MTTVWVPDVLGDGFEATTIALAADGDPGELVATVVRHRAAGAAPARGAAVYVHGFNDYFFQAELARWFAERCWDFYGIDLRRYGRSLREHQTPNMCASLGDYDEELDATAALVAADGHRSMVLVAHSTGGLTVPLWLARRPAMPVVGMVLNSPFLEFRLPAAVRAALVPAASLVARRDPNRTLPAGVSARYGESIHRSRRGEWEFDLAWKPLEAPVRVGWVRAVAEGQRTLHAGLDLTVPVLVLASTRTVSARSWTEDMTRGDAVLDADLIARWAPSIGRHVTIIRVADALHDVWLSAPVPRAEAYSVTGCWLDAWVATS